MYNTYKIEMYVIGTEENAKSLRKDLSLIVYDEFQTNSVFGVSVEQANPPEDIYEIVMVLCMVDLEDGLNTRQLSLIMPLLNDKKDYMQIEFHSDNTSAIGFIESEYYQMHDYKADFFEEQINAILEDKNLEKPDGIYLTPDGRQFKMGYFND